MCSATIKLEANQLKNSNQPFKSLYGIKINFFYINNKMNFVFPPSRNYVFQLIKAIKWCHQNDVIHRGTLTNDKKYRNTNLEHFQIVNIQFVQNLFHLKWLHDFYTCAESISHWQEANLKTSNIYFYIYWISRIFQ